MTHITQVIHHTWNETAECTCGWKREIPYGWLAWRASRKALRLAKEHEKAHLYVQELEP